MRSIFNYSVGQKAEESTHVTEQLIFEIARISNDYNPIHISEDYAANTPFSKRIAHGLVCEALISNLVGTQLPGPGAIFINISISFYKPIYIGDIVTARGEIVEIIESKSIMVIDIKCYNQRDELVVGSVSRVKLLETT